MHWAMVVACVLFGCKAATAQELDDTPEVQSEKRRGSISFDNKPGDFKFSAFDDEKGVVLFRAKLEGQDIWAMIDTGSDYSVVSERLVQELGLEKDQSEVSIDTISSSQNSRRIRDLNFEHIGQYSMVRDFYSFDLSGISKALGRQVDALIGYDLLRQLSFVLDSKNKRMLILISGMITPEDGRYRAIRLDGGVFEGTLNGVRTRFAVDLGSNGQISLHEKAWDRIFGDEPTISRGNATDGSGIVRETRGIENVQFEAFGATADVFVKKIPGENENFDAFVGYSMFYGRVAIFDYPKNVIYIEKEP
ncbi:MAG: retropepsin-like aspartic protease [Pseudomonadota bacterium]